MRRPIVPVAAPEQLKRPTGTGSEQRLHLVRASPFEEVVELVLAHGGLAQTSLDTLHAQGEEHHQQWHEN
jgi:hypothetical protein